MSALETVKPKGTCARKRAMGFERNPPNCHSCRSYKRPEIKLLRDSIPVRIEAWCNRGKFITASHAICDEWMASDGTVLQKAEA